MIQTILDTLRSPIKEIALEFSENETILYICTKYKEKTEYANLKGENSIVYGSSLQKYRDMELKIDGKQHFQLALADLKEVFEQMLELQKICIKQTQTQKNAPILLEWFKKHLFKPISTKRIFFIGMPLATMSSILAYFKSGTLEEITMVWAFEPYDAQRLFAMDQWKKAKILSFSCGDETKPEIKIENLLNFKRFEILIDTLTVSDAEKIRDTIMRSKHFEQCKIYTRKQRDESGVHEIFNVFKLAPHHQKFRFRYSVDDYDLVSDKEFV